MTDITSAIVAEARRLEEDTLYSAKGHFEVASLWQRVNVVVGTLATIAAALAAVFTLSHNDAVVITLAILVAISTGSMTFLNPSQIAAAHHDSGTQYNAIRNNARVFYTIDCQTSAASEELASRLKDLCRQRDDLSAKSPGIPHWAFTRARKGIEQGEAEYKVDVLGHKQQ